MKPSAKQVRALFTAWDMRDVCPMRRDILALEPGMLWEPAVRSLCSVSIPTNGILKLDICHGGRDFRV